MFTQFFPKITQGIKIIKNNMHDMNFFSFSLPLFSFSYLNNLLFHFFVWNVFALKYVLTFLNEDDSWLTFSLFNKTMCVKYVKCKMCVTMKCEVMWNNINVLFDHLSIINYQQIISPSSAQARIQLNLKWFILSDHLLTHPNLVAKLSPAQNLTWAKMVNILSDHPPTHSNLVAKLSPSPKLSWNWNSIYFI